MSVTVVPHYIKFMHIDYVLSGHISQPYNSLGNL